MLVWTLEQDGAGLIISVDGKMSYGSFLELMSLFLHRNEMEQMWKIYFQLFYASAHLFAANGAAWSGVPRMLMLINNHHDNSSVTVVVDYI